MQISTVEGNLQRLDGGAMFGNVPKALWSQWIPADEENRIELGCRTLLVTTASRVILFETGIGTYMSPERQQRYGVESGGHRLLSGLKELGVRESDVTDVILSHLHFDHAGGLLSSWAEDKPARLLFPNAFIYASSAAWERASHPHIRDRASFVPDLIRLLAISGRLRLLEGKETLRFDDLLVRFFVSGGHTPGMLCAMLEAEESKERLVVTADLIPGTAWIHAPMTMGYDCCPEALVDEKLSLYSVFHGESFWCFMTHDPVTAFARVGWDPDTEKYKAVETLESATKMPFKFSRSPAAEAC